jgi:hypothetical protein
MGETQAEDIINDKIEDVYEKIIYGGIECSAAENMGPKEQA